jgi:hypothetical protein
MCLLSNPSTSCRPHLQLQLHARSLHTLHTRFLSPLNQTWLSCSHTCPPGPTMEVVLPSLLPQPTLSPTYTPPSPLPSTLASTLP